MNSKLFKKNKKNAKFFHKKKHLLRIYYQVYTKSFVFVWEIFPRILGKRPKGILV